MTAERLAAALALATEDARMRQAAAEVGERIRSEDGVGTAVGVIERLAASKEPVGVWLKPARQPG